MSFTRIVIPLLLAFSAPTRADSFDVNMNNTAAQFKLGMSASGIGDGNAELQTRLLYNDNSDLLADAGLMVKGPGGGEEGAAGLIAGGGIKVLTGTLHQPTATHNLLCIALGGEVGFALPTAVPLALIGEYLGSPKILSFSDSERFNQYGLRLEVSASAQAKIYFGYREIGVGIKDAGSFTLDKGSHVGMSVAW